MGVKKWEQEVLYVQRSLPSVVQKLDKSFEREGISIRTLGPFIKH